MEHLDASILSTQDLQDILQELAFAVSEDITVTY